MNAMFTEQIKGFHFCLDSPLIGQIYGVVVSMSTVAGNCDCSIFLCSDDYRRGHESDRPRSRNGRLVH